ncbi:Ig-like protein [Leptospira perolatii]|uniref:Ig-like protein n=1 Tax=Leptospira perolatii TaxID=2023191 RepID=A0A2M9ZNK0_9LEPT|nr:Ig-like domain-containing protein [Leptospira perolatii]PJZ68713.1 Ig-like protein [Leptospira perolatii]PJZ73549.1 Ig-like protein [Leptospira perolatii]
MNQKYTLARIWTKQILKLSGTGLCVLSMLFSCSPDKKGGLAASLLASLGLATDSGGTMPSTNVVVPYTDTDTPAQLPVDFGNGGPQAMLNLASLIQVDRYKSLEIVFSEPMTPTSVESDFVLTESVGTALPGPVSGKGGTFYWKSGGRLVFDPYRELKPNTAYKLTLTSASAALEGGQLKDYQVEFTTEPDYLISASLNGKAVGPANYQKDLTYLDATPGTVSLNLTASFTNPITGPNAIQSITLVHMGSNASRVICSGTCDMTLPLASSLNLNGFTGAESGLKPFQGGNAYEFVITNTTGKSFRRSIGFNYGKVNATPYALLGYGASAILDGNPDSDPAVPSGVDAGKKRGQTLRLFSKILERFAKADYKIDLKTFNDYSTKPKKTDCGGSACGEDSGINLTTVQNSLNTRCIDYYRSGAGDINMILPFGDASGTYGIGYCGANGNTGAFNVNASVLGLGTLPMWLDVYITGISVPPTDPNGVANITDSIYAQGSNVMGLDINGRRAIINLSVIGYTHDCSWAGCLIGNDQKFYFTTTATVNLNAPYDPRLTRAKSTAVFNTSGNIGITINTPFTPNDAITGNFYVQPWWANLTVGNMNLEHSTSGLGEFLGAITEGIANNAVPQVTPAITQAMLKDIVQRIAPSAMNAVISSLNNPGLDIVLPDYLPTPLKNFPLSLKLKLRENQTVTISGSNKASVGSADVSLVAKNPLSVSDPNYHGHELTSGFVSTRPVSVSTPLTSSYAFSQSNMRPGLLLTLTADTVTQAAYSLWQNGALNLRINKQFIDTIRAYAGSDPLFELTNELVKVGTLMNILAPGRNTLIGLDPANDQVLITNVNSTDDVDIDVYPIHAPNGAFKFGGSNALPILEVNFTDLELRIYGRRPNSTRYLLNTVRVSLKGDGHFNFVPFDAPQDKPQYNNLNALSLTIEKDEGKLSYTLDILEGTQFNPFGLDPKGIFQVVNPLIRSLIVPLVNNVLRQVPLPKSLNIASITHPTNGTPCNLQATTDKLRLITVPIPNTEPYPYLFGGLQFQGAADTNPGIVVQCP